jgi:hypothetical protein
MHFNIGNGYSLTLLVFFMTYILFELPSTLALRHIKSGLQLSALAFSWGSVILGMGWANDWRVIVGCRTLIGALEAGFCRVIYTCLVVGMSGMRRRNGEFGLPLCHSPISFYEIKRGWDFWKERSRWKNRMALWCTINLVVSAFGNILPSPIVKLDGVYGIEAMDFHVSILYLYPPIIPHNPRLTNPSIEGALILGIAIPSYFIVLKFPDSILAAGKKGYFTQSELKLVLDRVERDHGDSLPDKLTWPKLWMHISSWQLW